MEKTLNEFLLDYLDNVEERRWEYEATVKAARERKKHGKPVNTRNLHEAKRHIAFYDHLRALINDDEEPKKEWNDRYRDIIARFLRENEDKASTISDSSLATVQGVFARKPSFIATKLWDEAQP